MLLHNLENSFLAGYRIPPLTFAETKDLPAKIAPVWAELRNGLTRPAFRKGYDILRSEKLDDEIRAALLGALASASWRNGMIKMARQLAEESTSLCRHQWLANRVLLSIELAENNVKTAAELLGTIELPKKLQPWDEPLELCDRHLLSAACSWMTGDWDATAVSLAKAYPDGVTSMPAALQEDWFRLAFYRDRPSDAAAAARQLIHEHSAEKADVLIQTLVHQGWHKEALALYRVIYDQDPANELLRRRVVGLCIREGEVKEARRLMELGALRLAS